MSSHDCIARGQLVLVVGTDLAAVQLALSEFINDHDLDFDELVEEDDVSLKADVLSLHIPFASWGGADNEYVTGLANSLADLCREPGVIELLDFDTGSSEEHCCPYFVGRNDEERLAARASYGIDRMAEWVKTLMTPEEFASVEHFIKAMCLSPARVDHYRGTAEIDGKVADVQFAAPAGAPALMLDAACLAALAQRANIKYDVVRHSL